MKKIKTLSTSLALTIELIVLTLVSSCKQPTVTNNTKLAWYKEQIIYNLDVKVFNDSDGDGIGDFKGLTSKLDYLQNLGVTTIWLAPFQPSPGDDDGYDVADYYSIDKRLGNEQDFKEFMNKAHDRKMRVIMDVVLNHSSIEHPWFKTAAADSSLAKHNWYLWSVKRPDDWNKGMGFPRVETATWTKDSTAQAYYFHRFYHFEPDFNYQNPEVIKEAEHILAFWLNKGLNGFRLDAVPFVIDDPRKSSEKPEFDFAILKRLAKFVKAKNPDAVLLGEANVKPEEIKDYFAKNNDGLDMMFNFEVNEYLFYALATGNTNPLKKALQLTSEKPPAAQWAYFLRNHDEVDIDKLSKNQKQEVYASMGPDTAMQLYDRGIRRRLAPMLNNDINRLKMAYAFLFALPGTPVLRYGEEIGMGDDLSLKERLSVRTPMQWDSTLNSGFSTAKKTIRPVIAAGENGYPVVNVAAEIRNNASLLNFVKHITALRKKHPQLSAGKWEVIDSGSDRVLALVYSEQNQKSLLLFNFSSKNEEAEIKIKADSKITELISGHQENISSKANQLSIRLKPYDYKWYLLSN